MIIWNLDRINAQIVDENLSLELDSSNEADTSLSRVPHSVLIIFLPCEMCVCNAVREDCSCTSIRMISKIIYSLVLIIMRYICIHVRHAYL